MFEAPPLEDCLTGLTGSSTQAGTGDAELQLIGSSAADCQCCSAIGVQKSIFFGIALKSLKSKEAFHMKVKVDVSIIDVFLQTMLFLLH